MERAIGRKPAIALNQIIATIAAFDDLNGIGEANLRIEVMSSFS